MATTTLPSLTRLAEQMLEQAKRLEVSLSSPLSFQEDLFQTATPEQLRLRTSLLSASDTFTALLEGATGPHGRLVKAPYVVSKIPVFNKGRNYS